MSKHSDRMFWSAMALIPLIVLGILAVKTWRDVAWSADQSALEQIEHNISAQLSAIPPGQPYPQSLSDLTLTYGDGGDSSFLSRIEYHSTGRSCTLRSILNHKEVLRTFPATK